MCFLGEMVRGKTYDKYMFKSVIKLPEMFSVYFIYNKTHIYLLHVSSVYVL